MSSQWSKISYLRVRQSQRCIVMFRKLPEYWILFSIENRNRCMFNYLHPGEFSLKIQYFYTFPQHTSPLSTVDSQTKLTNNFGLTSSTIALSNFVWPRDRLAWLSSLYWIFYARFFFQPSLVKDSWWRLFVLFFLNTLFSHPTRLLSLSLLYIKLPIPD